jgi:hypothetical protein
MPVTDMLLAHKERGPGDVLETAMARSRAAEARQAREDAAGAFDPDEHAANLVSRGYTPGLLNQLSQRLADTTAELAAEEDKLERAAKRQARIARDHAAGRITAFDIARMQADDVDEGDRGTVERLERRAANLRQQIADASAMISPAEQRDADPVAAAASRAHETFRQVTRAKMAEAVAGRPERRPFASPGVADPAPDAMAAFGRAVGIPWRPAESSYQVPNLGTGGQ